MFYAIGFPPAAKSSTYRLREMANQFVGLGWRVTVVTTVDESWESDFGLDRSLLAEVDRSIDVVKVPLFRRDLDTDIRAMSRKRAADLAGWRKRYLAANQEVFPEPSFGRWLEPLVEAGSAVHRREPVDLVLASCVPYVLLSVVRRLKQDHGLPYAIDYRDGWSVDVIGGGEAFETGSRSGRIEGEALEDAEWITFVNNAIRDFYAARFPGLSARMHVIRNGYDPSSVPGDGRAPATDDSGVAFGHVGVMTFPVVLLQAVLDGWRVARSRDPLVARSTLAFRGATGAGSIRGANDHVDLLRSAAAEDVSYGGPVPKSEMADLYRSWDALVLLIMGGRYMTSGKVYEYAATGLPIVSAHARDHDASVVLEGRPLWTGALGFEPDDLAGGFELAARWAVGANEEERRQAAAHAHPFARRRSMRDGLEPVTEQFLDGRR